MSTAESIQESHNFHIFKLSAPYVFFSHFRRWGNGNGYAMKSENKLFFKLRSSVTEGTKLHRYKIHIISNLFGKNQRLSYEYSETFKFTMRRNSKAGHTRTHTHAHTRKRAHTRTHSRDHKMCSHMIASQHFMEPQCSLPLSQELSTCTCSELGQFSPHNPTLSLQDQSYCYLPTYALAFLVVSFPWLSYQ
jgi:hypothetical protein